MLTQCQNKMINNPIEKEIGWNGIPMIKYACDKKEIYATYLVIFIDEENSPMHHDCIKKGIVQVCSDCKYQSSENV